MNTDLEEQEDELLALQSIFDSEEFVRDESKSAGEIRVSVELPADFNVYEISFLPPLLLTFDLPQDYPSSSPPSFTLTCSWLTHPQLSSLHALGVQLTDLYQATRGAVVLFSWVQFLREDALKFLDIHSVLELPSDEHNTELYPCEPHLPGSSSQVQENPSTSDGITLMSQILLYNAAQKQKLFTTTLFDCGVCFMSWLGSECVQLFQCGHIFCKPCLAKFCKVQIKEGNVRGVTCPEADCGGSPTPAQVRSLVGEELFSRYDRLLLQSTLDHMADVTYCPRNSCGSAVIVDTSSTAAMCSVCNFAFCVKCKKTYHGLLSVLLCVSEGLKAVWDDYSSASKERKRILERRYGRDVMQGTLTMWLSDDWITDNCKHCPHCFCKIQKISGCNVMTCTRCHQLFCWACLTRLEKYGSDHFQSSDCSTWSFNAHGLKSEIISSSEI
uniref:RBR-type E3 ubiquitin transferase n=1 Tax=Amphiprion percula TaxID=161767 RepID=A0A3P8T4Z9_AMPPE